MIVRPAVLYWLAYWSQYRNMLAGVVGEVRLPAEALPGVLLPESHGLHRVQVSTCCCSCGQ